MIAQIEQKSNQISTGLNFNSYSKCFIVLNQVMNNQSKLIKSNVDFLYIILLTTRVNYSNFMIKKSQF